MSYVKPTTLVYQELQNSGGANPVTPDLNTVIIGPAYNILQYVAGNTASLVNTAALGTLTTTGSMTANGVALTVASTAGFGVGEQILVAGAGASGAVLQATILNIAGNVMTLTTPASVAVTNAAVTASGVIGSNLVPTVLALPGQLPGQLVDPTSIQVWLNNAAIQTMVTGVTGTPGSNALSVATTTTTGSTTASSNVLNVSSAGNFVVGDLITVAGAGVSGGLLTATITGITGTAFTLSTVATTAVVTAAVTKLRPANINALTNTLNAVPGATVVISYVNSGSVAKTFNTTLLTVTTTSGLNGNVTNVTTADVMPTDFVTFGGMAIEQTFNNQVLPVIDPVSGATSYLTSTVSTSGQITINPNVHLAYGLVLSAAVNISYRAQRTDIANELIAYYGISDVVGQFNVISDQNPLALGLQCALANTTGMVYGMAVASDDLIGHEAAMSALENQRVYALAPLTQDLSILTAYQAHCDQLSLPTAYSWRVLIANTALPLTQNMGAYSSTNVNINAGNNTISLVSGVYVLTASNATFISDGVNPGDTVNVTLVSTGTTGTYQVQTILSNQQLVLNATAAATGVGYYVSRNMTTNQIAQNVAAQATSFNDNRVWYVQPDQCGVPVNGVTTTVGGQYLCAAIAGAVSGQPVQQGFTNMGLAGISALYHSNFFFRKADLDTMAAAGVCLVVQKTQTSTPYIRHALTTNVTTLQYREQLIVKNWDYLSYYYHDIMDAFIGSWNITPDTLNILQQTVVSASEYLKTQRLPRIGSPLLGYNQLSVAQEATSQDRVQIMMNISIVDPLNYMDFYLII
jgi:uncharacterized protein YejL (UPF0352 family)